MSPKINHHRYEVCFCHALITIDSNHTTLKNERTMQTINIESRQHCPDLLISTSTFSSRRWTRTCASAAEGARSLRELSRIPLDNSMTLLRDVFTQASGLTNTEWVNVLARLCNPQRDSNDLLKSSGFREHRNYEPEVALARTNATCFSIIWIFVDVSNFHPILLSWFYATPILYTLLL